MVPETRNVRARGALKSRVLGIWVSAVLLVSVVSVAADPLMPAPRESATAQAGVFDDFFEYLACLWRAIIGEECIYDADGDGEPDPAP